MEVDELFQAQRQLSEKDLIIYNAELQKKSKSVGLAYFLLIFFGGLGLHKFYLGKIGEGIAYLIVGTIDFIFLQIIIFNADKYWEPNGFIFVLFGISAIFLLSDLFTLPTQIAEQEKLLRIDLLIKFGILFEIVDKFKNSEDDDSIDG
jgi:TM2 domain-containing membrane protein YozV